jgi:hypothetical protein
VIPEIDIWRAATLMLKRYGENAHMESAAPPTNLPPTATTAQRSGAGSLMPSRSSQAQHPPARCTDGQGRASLNRNLLDLVARDLVAGAIVEPGGGQAFVRGQGPRFEGPVGL